METDLTDICFPLDNDNTNYISTAIMKLLLPAKYFFKQKTPYTNGELQDLIKSSKLTPIQL